ncbi:hypothetical protein EPO15_01140 [bacterium]|nr:MAG: hypothetical protein EPO15_01140 [bacterium]
MLKVETPKPLPPETKAPPAPPTKGKSRYDLTIPDIGVGKEVKGGFGEGSYRGKFKGVKEEEQASGQGRSDSGDALLAQAGTAAQAPAESPVQFGIPELMRTEAPDNGASRFAELSRIAGTKAARGDRAGALAEADAMIKLQPWNAEARLYKANLLNGVRRFAEAEAAAREAVRLDPENAEAWKAMGWAQLHQRKFAEAEKALSRAINLLEARRAAGEDTEELRNALASAYAMRAFAYEGLGRRDKLIADLERASQLDPARFTRHLADARAGKTIFDPDAEDTWTLLSALPEAPGSPAPARGLLVAGGLAQSQRSQTL